MLTVHRLGLAGLFAITLGFFGSAAQAKFAATYVLTPLSRDSCIPLQPSPVNFASGACSPTHPWRVYEPYLDSNGSTTLYCSARVYCSDTPANFPNLSANIQASGRIYVGIPVRQGAFTCPSGSKLSGQTCTCNQGYVEKNKACIATTELARTQKPRESTACEATQRNLASVIATSAPARANRELLDTGLVVGGQALILEYDRGSKPPKVYFQRL